jgi:hypothetical protein
MLSGGDVGEETSTFTVLDVKLGEGTWFGLLLAFIEHLKIVGTSEDSGIAISHAVQFTTTGITISDSALSSPFIAG